MSVWMHNLIRKIKRRVNIQMVKLLTSVNESILSCRVLILNLFALWVCVVDWFCLANSRKWVALPSVQFFYLVPDNRWRWKRCSASVQSGVAPLLLSQSSLKKKKVVKEHLLLDKNKKQRRERRISCLKKKIVGIELIEIGLKALKDTC